MHSPGLATRASATSLKPRFRMMPIGIIAIVSIIGDDKRSRCGSKVPSIWSARETKVGKGWYM
jgi:hypothetical protein